MPRPSDFNAPVCPYCCHSMKRAGKVKSQKKVLDANLTTFTLKQRWRCVKCHYGETVDSVAPNSNIRTGYGVEKRVRFGVPNKPQFNTSQFPLCPSPLRSRQAQIPSH